MSATSPHPFHGVLPILPTPFHDDESLDLTSLAALVELMAAAGASGVVVLGVLGEAQRLLDVERAEVVAAAVAAAAGRLPVIAGASHAGTHAATGLARMAARRGASGILVAPPRDAAGNDERIVEHYRRVSAGAGIAVCVQDHPASSEVRMSVALLVRLAREVAGVGAIKAEDLPSPPKVSQLVAATAGGTAILTGLGALYGYFDLESGAQGFMTGFAFPEVLVAILDARARGDDDAAFRIYQRFLPLLVFEQQPGVAVRKEILRRRGALTSARVRHPGAGLDEGTRVQLDALLARVLPGIDLARPLAAGGVE